MKLVFPGGEHPSVMLTPGSNRLGPIAAGPEAVGAVSGAWQSDMVMTRHGVTLHVPAGADVAINGRAVAGVIALRSGDLVAFDGIPARLADLRPTVPDVAAAASIDDDPQATTVRPSVPRYLLRGMSGDAFGRSHPLTGPTTVGRAPDNLLRIDHAGISRNHARITPDGDGLLVEDLGSANGSFVNDARIARARAVHDDELRFDTLRYRVVAPVPPLSARLPSASVERRGGHVWWWLLVAVLVGAAIATAVIAID